MISTVNSKRTLKVDISSKNIFLCDLDGTLIETDYANYLSYMQALEEETGQKHDIPFNPRKRFNREELKVKIPYLSENQYNNIVSAKNVYFNKHLTKTKVNPFLLNIIKNNIVVKDLVLVTTSREKRAVETLRHHDLLDCFSRLICWEVLSKYTNSNKYMIANSLLHADPMFSIIFENDVDEINNAILAGVPKKNIIRVEFHN